MTRLKSLLKKCSVKQTIFSYCLRYVCISVLCLVLYFFLFAVFPSDIIFTTSYILRDLLDLCFRWLMFPGVTGVKFPLIPFDTAFWNPWDFDFVINAITCIEAISSVCSKINYSSLNTSLTQLPIFCWPYEVSVKFLLKGGFWNK